MEALESRSRASTADAVCQGQVATSSATLWLARAQCGGQVRTSTTSVSRFNCGVVWALTVPSTTLGAAISFVCHASRTTPERAKLVRATFLDAPAVSVECRVANAVSPKSSLPCRNVSDVSVMGERNLSVKGVAVPKLRSATSIVVVIVGGGGGGGLL